MLISDEDLKVMTGYSYEELGVELHETGSIFYPYSIDRKDFVLLFERVRELSFAAGQENILDNLTHC